MDYPTFGKSSWSHEIRLMTAVPAKTVLLLVKGRRVESNCDDGWKVDSVVEHRSASVVEYQTVEYLSLHLEYLKATAGVRVRQYVYQS